MYISLKDGWLPLSDLCVKYEKDKGNMNRILDKIKDCDKEKIGNSWVVRESTFIEYIKTDKVFPKNSRVEIGEVVDKFTTELAKKLKIEEVKSKLSIENVTQGDYIIQTFLEWAVAFQMTFPNEIYRYLQDEELFTKSLLIVALWNKTLKNK